MLNIHLLPAYDTTEGPAMPTPRPCSGSVLGKDGKPWIKTCKCHFGQPARTDLRLVSAR